MIKVTNLNKYFNKNKSNEIHVINNTTIEFPEKGIVTIFGESGCGKTTLLNVIGGLDDFHSGSIEIDDTILHKYSYRKVDKLRNEKIGYIFQNYLLLQNRTVYENLMLVLDMYNLSTKEKNDRIDYVLKAVGMLKYKKKNVTLLSGGQQQRVAIARALIKSPNVILADEPTGNLDEKNTIEIMNILKKISQNTLVILVSHEFNIARSYSDYLLEIKDGVIKTQKCIEENNKYSYEDDQNIYLKEYKKEVLSNENVVLEYYSNEKEESNLKIVYKNGKLFIQSDKKIVLVNDESEVNFINDYKKELDANVEISKNDFNLKKIDFVRSPSLSLKETLKIAKSNLKSLKKRTFFLSFPLIIIIVLMLFSVQSIKGAIDINPEELVRTDSHIYNITVEKGDINVNAAKGKNAYGKLYDKFKQSNPNIEIINNYYAPLSYTLNGFSQLENEKYEITTYSILPTTVISEDDIIYGNMPKNATEIVIEKTVLENLLNKSTLGNFMTTRNFIGETVRFKSLNYDLTISGISDTKENTVYINKWQFFNLVASPIKFKGFKIGPLSELNNYMDTSNITLENNEIIMSDQLYTPGSSVYYVVNEDPQLNYKIKNRINLKGFYFDIIINDEEYDKILKSVLQVSPDEMFVYCENDSEREQVELFIENNFDEFKNSNESILIFGNYNYYDNLKGYLDEAHNVAKSRTLITVSVLVISLLIVYLLMKSYSLKNIYDIGVYRALGIKKRSIVLIYGFEILLISLKTTFVGGFLAFAITNIMNIFPYFDTEYLISFNLFISCTSLVIFLNVIVGVLPIIGYLKYTPYKILSKQ